MRKWSCCKTDFYEDVERTGGIPSALTEKLTNLPYVGDAFKGWETIGAGMANEDVMATNPIYQCAKNKLYPAVDEWRKSKEQAQTGVGYPIPDRNIYPPRVQDFEFSEYQGPSKEVEGDYPVGKKGFQFPSFLREGLGAIRDVIKPMSPELKAQSRAFQDMGMVDPSQPQNFAAGPMEGYNIASAFGTNDPSQMIMDRINKIKNRKMAQTETSLARIAKLQEMKAASDRAAAAVVPTGWNPETGGGGPGASWRTPGHAWGQPDYRGGASGEVSQRGPGRSADRFAAQGGYMRSRYSNGGRVGILAAF